MKAGRSSTGAVVEGGLQAGSFRETVRKYSVSGKAFRGIDQYLKEKETNAMFEWAGHSAAGTCMLQSGTLLVR